MLQATSYFNSNILDLQLMQEMLDSEKIELTRLKSLLEKNSNNQLGELFRQSVQHVYPELTAVGPETLNMDRMTPKQFDAAIQAGIDDMVAGRVISSENLEQDLKNRFGDLWAEDE